MFTGLKILYVGPVGRDGTCRQRLAAFRRLGHTPLAIDTLAPYASGRWRLLRALFARSNVLFDWRRVNKAILNSVNSFQPSVMWVDKGLIIQPAVLKIIRQRYPRVKLVHYSPDDMLHPVNQSKLYVAGIPVYHFHITTKSYNVGELCDLGAQQVIFIGNAFDESVHYPRILDRREVADLGCEVGFVGGFETDRFEAMQHLARNGVAVVFRCPGWSHFKRKYAVANGLTIVDRYFDDASYAKVISATKVNLGFLRKSNRDLQTTRSVEIPASGGFMLAERTSEHLDLFTEGEEAEFFVSNDELLGKVRFYLANESARQRIAQGGYERCLNSGYGNQQRLEMILRRVL